MESPLERVGRELLQGAGDALLSQPLDQLAEQVDDDETRELLLSLHASGAGDRLRDALQTGSLTRFAAETCTPREEQALCRQLASWLGRGASGGDDPERLVQIPAAPADGAALLAWADQHQLTRELMRPAAEVLRGADGTLAELCLEPGRSLAQQRAADQARQYLRARAAALAGQRAREALHSRKLPEGALGLLARRLRALLDGHGLEALAGMRFVPARPVELELTSGVVEGTLVPADEGAPDRARIWLSGFEQHALAHRCSRCGQARCVHVAALAARVFEAAQSRDDRLHPTLVQFSSVPSWKRFLSALGSERPQLESALTFALRSDGEALMLGALRAGKLASVAKLARSPAVSDRDRAVLSALHSRSLGPSYLPVDAQVLRSLIEHPGVQGDDGRALSVLEEPVHVALLERPEGLALQATLGGVAVEPVPLRAGQPARDYVFQRQQGLLVFAPLTPPLQRLLQALNDFRGTLPPESYPQLAAQLAPLRQVARVSTPRALDGYDRPAPRKLLLRITPGLDEGVDVSLMVRALPLAPLWPPGRGPALVHGLEGGTPCSVRRELERERTLAAELSEALGFEQLLVLNSPFDRRIETTAGALELLSRAARQSDKLELEWAERARPLRIATTLRSGDLKIQLFKRGDFIALQGGAQQGELTVAVERLLQAARTGERFVPIEGGDYAEIEQELFERLSNAQLCMLPRLGSLKLSAAALLPWLRELGPETHSGDAQTAEWIALARAEPAALAHPLALPLRHYQEQGASWLIQRSRWAPGVVLADEMGLGKTAQAIALLVERAARGPALVLAPTSVVDNWIAELGRFAPALKPLRYRGAERASKLAELAPGAVLVTSYDVMLRDASALAEREFASLIFDEAQVLKNARTLRARAAAGLHAEFRVALSGTPVENRLGDVWSLFHLLVPGLLGSWARFRARFAVPIERYENEERSAALRGLVMPFLLRRTKREVEQELPPRTDVVHLVELSQAERDLYDAALAHARRAIGKRRGVDDTARAVQILAELTRLRQLACHPRLVLEDERVTSSKLEALLGLLDDVLPRGHRVLIFSQFVRHLGLVREALDARGIISLTLDGSTPAAERGARVAAFQAGEAAVFLISLKAGGTGLNLTAADYVVHLDPWWNPSAEDQASDRAHRIGQQHPVTVVKLVAQGTIEERVLGLHAHKRRLARVVTDGGEPIEGLDLEALQALIAE
jgi:superfamily II DNA or RNA helicase